MSVADSDTVVAQVAAGLGRTAEAAGCSSEGMAASRRLRE
jgi:hypothetical protein